LATGRRQARGHWRALTKQRISRQGAKICYFMGSILDWQIYNLTIRSYGINKQHKNLISCIKNDVCRNNPKNLLIARLNYLIFFAQWRTSNLYFKWLTENSILLWAAFLANLLGIDRFRTSFFRSFLCLIGLMASGQQLSGHCILCRSQDYGCRIIYRVSQSPSVVAT